MLIRTFKHSNLAICSFDIYLKDVIGRYHGECKLAKIKCL